VKAYHLFVVVVRCSVVVEYVLSSSYKYSFYFTVMSIEICEKNCIRTLSPSGETKKHCPKTPSRVLGNKKMQMRMFWCIVYAYGDQYAVLSFILGSIDIEYQYSICLCSDLIYFKDPLPSISIHYE